MKLVLLSEAENTIKVFHYVAEQVELPLSVEKKWPEQESFSTGDDIFWIDESFFADAKAVPASFPWTRSILLLSSAGDGRFYAFPFAYELTPSLDFVEIIGVTRFLQGDDGGEKKFLNTLLQHKIHLQAATLRQNKIVQAIAHYLHVMGQQAVENHCLHHCQHNRNYGFVEVDRKNYYSIDEACKVRSTRMESLCQLRKFSQQINLTPYFAEPSLSNINKMLDYLINKRREFCSQCPKVQKNIEFKKSDILISSHQELMQGICFYCREHDCSLMLFFLNFSYKL